MQGPPAKSAEDRPQPVFVTKRELAVLVERYLKDEKLEKTLKVFQEEQAKLLKNAKLVCYSSGVIFQSSII